MGLKMPENITKSLFNAQEIDNQTRRTMRQEPRRRLTNMPNRLAGMLNTLKGFQAAETSNFRLGVAD